MQIRSLLRFGQRSTLEGLSRQVSANLNHRRKHATLTLVASAALMISATSLQAEFESAASGQTPAPPSQIFSLGFSYGGGSYVAVVYGDANDYASLQASQSGHGAVAAQATYLVGSVSGSYPLYAISVYPGVTGDYVGPEVTGAERTEMLLGVFTWADTYTTIYVPDTICQCESTGAESFVGALEAGPISNQWQQQAGIDAAAVMNVLTVVGPLMDDIQDALGDEGADQVQDFISLFGDIIEGDADGSFSGTWSSITSTLATDGLIANASTSFTGPQFLQSLTSYPAGNLPTLITDLYQDAYPSQSPPSQSVTDEIQKTIEETLVDSGGDAATTAGEVYFGAEASSISSALSSGVSAASEDFMDEGLPFALANILNVSFIQPEAYMLQEEVNLQNIEVSLLSQFEDVEQALGYDTGSSISLGNGNELFDLEGLMLAFGGRWSSVDYQLVESETLRCAIPGNTCSSQETSDQSFSASLVSDDSDLESYQQDAQTLLNTLPDNIVTFITASNLPSGMVNQPYLESIGVSGGTAPYSWSVTGGSPPPWMSLGGTSGQLSGTPTTTGSWNFTVQVTDSGNPAQDVSATFSITVAPDTLSVATNSLPAGIFGSPYSAMLVAQGGTTPYTWTKLSGTLPTGVSLNPNGLISGTPTSSGTYQVAFEVTDSGTPTPQNAETGTLSISIAPATLAITTETMPIGNLGDGYFADLNAQGGVAPYHWRVISGSPPPGTSLGSVNSVTGDIAGVPSQTGAFKFKVKVTDSESPAVSTTRSLSITVLPAPLVLSPGELAGATEGDSYSSDLLFSGGTAPLDFSVTSGTLPSGLGLGLHTGGISGVPSNPGSYSFDVTVTDSGSPTQEETASYTLVVLPHPLAVTTGYLPAAFAGEGYDAGLSAGWGTAPYGWSITSGTLPSGLSFSEATGAITGTPTTPGTSNLTFTVTDSASPPNSAAVSLTLEVLPASDALSPQPVPTDASSGDTLSSVSCPTTSWCAAVGASNTYDLPLIEQLSGGYWQLQPSPARLTYGQLDGVSCISTSFCMAVGTSTDTGNNETVAAEWDGTSWSAIPTPNQEVNGIASSLANFLTSVSCTSDSFCLAVGYYLAPTTGTETNLAEEWNGSSWSLLSPPVLGLGGVLTGVSCTASGSFCAATGNYYPGGGSSETGLLMTWSGSWNADGSLPTSTEQTTSVSCTSTSFCTAVGDGLTPLVGGSQNFYPTGFQWNGSGWSATMTTFENGGLYGELDGIACVSQTSCEAVGLNYDDGGNGGSLVVYYQNGTWSAASSPSTSGASLTSIGCSAGFCTAVGAASGLPFADMTGSPPPPGTPASVQSFSVSPQSLPAGGGDLSFDWSTSNASACTITSTPALSGLPTDVACGNGSGSATVPANTTNTASSYGFQLTAIGVGGTSNATQSAGPVTEAAPQGLDLTWSESALSNADPDSNEGNVACASSTECSVSGLTSSNTNAVWTTTNSGDSWAESVVPNSSLGDPSCNGVLNVFSPCLIVASSEDMYFIGYATSQQNPALWVSTNGGVSWNQEAIPGDLYGNFALSCPGATTCYLAAGPDDFFETTDGGTSWSSVSGNLSSVLYGNPRQLVCYNTNGCILTENNSEGMAVTTDGGVEWTEVSILPQEVQCLNANNCLMATGAQLESSNDGGSSWSPMGTTIPSQGAITSFSCASNDVCVATDDSNVYSTSDGGDTWNNVTPTSSCYEGQCGSRAFIYGVDIASVVGPVYINGLDGDSGHLAAWTGVPLPSQTIDFVGPGTGQVGGSAMLTATGGASGQPVVFSVDPSSGAGVCAVSGANGTIVNYTGVGSCVIDANQAGSSEYSAAPQVQQTISVGPGSQTIAFTTPAPSGATVDGSVYVVAATGGASGNPVTFTIDSTAGSVCSIASGDVVSFIGIGTCVIDANQTGSATYNPAPQAQQSFAVSPPSCPGGFGITPATLPGATKGIAYSETLTGCGGTSPYTFKKIGKLPKGLKLSSTGVITGVPKHTETGSFRVKMADHDHRTVIQSYSIVVSS